LAKSAYLDHPDKEDLDALIDDAIELLESEPDGSEAEGEEESSSYDDYSDENSEGSW
jgi:hypothetical protein